jgi:hypothetical protein
MKQSKSRALFTLASLVAVVVVAAALAGPAAAGTGVAGKLTAFKTVTLGNGSSGSSTDTTGKYEFPGGVDPDSAEKGHPNDRSLSTDTFAGVVTAPATKTKANPELVTSFDGINHFVQRFGTDGQFSLEPPDQGLCVGNGFVVETVNDTIRVDDTSGNALSTQSLNAFYGYPVAIDRSTVTYGPFVTDPSCAYDAAAKRWIHVVLTLDVVPSTGDFTGGNHLDIAVSKTADPRGQWTVYQQQVGDDCDSVAGPCIGDYPHIGFDANGFYVTTNSYPFFTDGFDAAWIYAYSKSQLESGAFSVNSVKMSTVGADNGNPGFTVLPASGSQQVATGAGGTQYFLSSNAAEEANGNGSSSDLLLWALTNTTSLNDAKPSLSLSHTTLGIGTYGIPPESQQKAGDVPQATCLNNSQCAIALLGHADGFKEVEGPLDSSDTRMLATTYAQGKLWGALDTAVTVSGQRRAGIEWFVVTPSASSSGVSGSVALQGYLGAAGADLSYPAIGVTTSGKGAMGFTLAGPDNYPSQGYTSIDAVAGVGAIHTAAAGLGPTDGFSEYKGYGTPVRPRWGDYGAAAVDGSSVWLANEYIGQTCTYSQYVSSNFRCGDTRTALANWGTRITQVTP